MCQFCTHFVSAFPTELYTSGRYSREESFTTLNVDIRNHQNLLESLEQYVKGDLLEGANAYHCEKCNKKVRTKLSEPPVLPCPQPLRRWTYMADLFSFIV